MEREKQSEEEAVNARTAERLQEEVRALRQESLNRALTEPEQSLNRVAEP
jgi:hypothetical protein